MFKKLHALPQWLMYLPLFLLLVCNAPAAAYIKTITGQLNLSATIDGEPAFQQVTWQLKPMNIADRPNMTITRHSAVIDLEAGQYEVTTTWGNTTKTQQITIEEGGKHKLVVNLK